MDIYINGNKIDYKPLFPLTWGNFFQKLLQDDNYIPKDHGIVELTVDDVDSLQVMIEESDKMVPETIKVIKVATKNSFEITKDGFAKATTLLDSIKKEINTTADLYREGKIKEASDKIIKIMEAIKPMVNFINSVGMSFSLNFDEILFDPNTSLREKVEQFLESFTELVTAQQKRDYVEIADYLEYQLTEDMTDWNKIINLLLREVEALHAKDV
jgi:prophage DNA circulation protein